MQKNVNIDENLIYSLIIEQFPEWSRLKITSIDVINKYNRSFRLGDNTLIRLAISEDYALQIQKEQKYLPLIAPYLSTSILKVLAFGKPYINHPWNLAVFNWL